MSEQYDDWDGQEEWYEPLKRAFCDNYEPHEPHVYNAINSETYSCAGMTAAELAEIEAYYAQVGTCEHGLSADLCAGPGHYPPDERY